MPRVRWSLGARSDLSDLKRKDPDAVAYLATLFAEAQQCPELFESLSTHDFGKDKTEDISVSKWHSQQRHGRNLWRCRAWGFQDYRVIYAFHPEQPCYYILAVVKRSQINYDDPIDPLTRRICDEYERIGIPDYGGRY